MIRSQPSSMSRKVVLRRINPEDGDFLRAVYASTRAEELRFLDWSDQQRQTFIDTQFQAQSRSFSQYPAPEYSIIEVDGINAGRLYVSATTGEVRVVDITLLPEFRGAGIGTELLEQLIAVARDARQRVVLSVEQNNPARNLYERIGFRVTGTSGFYLVMELLAEGVNAE